MLREAIPSPSKCLTKCLSQTEKGTPVYIFMFWSFELDYICVPISINLVSLSMCWWLIKFSMVELFSINLSYGLIRIVYLCLIRIVYLYIYLCSNHLNLTIYVFLFQLIWCHFPCVYNKLIKFSMVELFSINLSYGLIRIVYLCLIKCMKENLIAYVCK